MNRLIQEAVGDNNNVQYRLLCKFTMHIDVSTRTQRHGTLKIAYSESISTSPLSRLVGLDCAGMRTIIQSLFFASQACGCAPAIFYYHQ